MKRFAPLLLFLGLQAAASTSYYISGLLPQPNAERARAYLGITNGAGGLTNLPANVITNTQTGVTLSGTFSGSYNSSLNGILKGNGLSFGTAIIGSGLSFDGTTLSATGAGSVTNVTAGNLSPLFTTIVSDPTSHPAIAFSQVSQTQNKVFASPDGISGNPTFRSLLASDIPALPYQAPLPDPLTNRVYVTNLVGSINVTNIQGLGDAQTNSILSSPASVIFTTNGFLLPLVWNQASRTVLSPDFTNFYDINYLSYGAFHLEWSTNYGVTWSTNLVAGYTSPDPNTNVTRISFVTEVYDLATSNSGVAVGTAVSNIVVRQMDRPDLLNRTNQLYYQHLRVPPPLDPDDATPKYYVDQQVNSVSYIYNNGLYLNQYPINLSGNWMLMATNDQFKLDYVGVDMLNFSPRTLNIAPIAGIRSTNRVIYITVATNSVNSKPLLQYALNLAHIQWNWLDGVVTVTNSYPSYTGTNYTLNFSMITNQNTVFLRCVYWDTTIPNVAWFGAITGRDPFTVTNLSSSTFGRGAGLMCSDSNYLYLSVATNLWKKISLDGGGGGGGAAAGIDYGMTNMPPYTSATNYTLDFSWPSQIWVATNYALRGSINWPSGNTSRVVEVFIPPTNVSRTVGVYDAATNWQVSGFVSSTILPTNYAANLRVLIFGQGETNVFCQYIPTGLTFATTNAGGGGTPGAFDPLSIAGCTLWLKGSTGLYQDETGTTPCTLNGQTVKYWADQSGNGNHHTNASSACTWSQYGANGGNGCVRFYGGGATSTRLWSKLNDVHSSTFWLFIVSDWLSSGANQTMYDGKGSGSSSTIRLFGGIGDKIELSQGSTVDDGVMPNNQWHLMTVKFANASSLLRTNGVQSMTADLGGNTATGDMLGAGYYGDTYNGNIAEVLVYQTGLTTANVTNIENYLNTKYSIY